MRILLAAAIMMACAQTAGAETCQEKFTRVMTDRSTKEPVKIHLTHIVKGVETSTTWSYQDGKGNWRTEVIKPENQTWSMAADNVMYFSTNKGKSWKFMRKMGPEYSPEATRAQLVDYAKTVRDTNCGEDTIDGVTYDTVAGTYDMTAGAMRTEIREKFWVDRKTGFIPRSEMHMKSQGSESTILQKIQKAPGLVIKAPK